ncbi:MAG: histidine kinase [Xanthomarina sp.]
MKYLFSKKSLPNYILWSIILIPSYIIKYPYAVNEVGYEPLFVILEGLSWYILVIILTAAIQYGLDRFTRVDEHLGLKIFKFIVLVAIASLIFNLILWPFLEVLFVAINKKQPNEPGILGTNITNWFVWMVWYLILSFLKLYQEVKETKVKNAELLSSLKESQLNTLKGQINPHFMFNSLNNIRGLMLEDVDKARNMLTRLSETLRYSLTKSDINSIALEKELEMVENYIEISKIQFEDRLTYKSAIDLATRNIQIPPMIIQMLVENAIKHGISNLKEGGEVQLLTKLEVDKLLIEVTNTGLLKECENTTRLGLKNIKQRLHLLYGDNSSFKLEEKNNQVIATIKIPLI